MNVSEQIARELSTLPAPMQSEVLDFVGYLKARRLASSGEDCWNLMSLQGALSGMEQDIFPEYRESDLVEHWK
jgi:hypothetical protein